MRWMSSSAAPVVTRRAPEPSAATSPDIELVVQQHRLVVGKPAANAVRRQLVRRSVVLDYPVKARVDVRR